MLPSFCFHSKRNAHIRFIVNLHFTSSVTEAHRKQLQKSEELTSHQRRAYFKGDERVSMLRKSSRRIFVMRLM